jgi:hypothetical protein
MDSPQKVIEAIDQVIRMPNTFKSIPLLMGKDEVHTLMEQWIEDEVRNRGLRSREWGSIEFYQLQAITSNLTQLSIKTRKVGSGRREIRRRK